MNTTITTTICAPTARHRAALCAAFLLALLAPAVARAERGAGHTDRPAGGRAEKGVRGAGDAMPAPAPDGVPDKGDPTPTGTVNLNEATEEQLQLLPGIGPSKAAAIVAWRTKHGRFKKVDDLTRVKGFGRKTLQKLRSGLALTGPTTYRGKKNPPGDSPSGSPPADGTP